MEGIVEKRTISKGGNPVLTISGQAYNVGPKSGLDVSRISIGDKLSFEGHSYDYRGVTYWSLDSYKVLAHPPPSPQGVAPIAAPTAQGPSQNAQGGITDVERPFISNCVAHAIASGCIKEPEQIEKWVCAAKNALRSQGD